MSDFVASTDIMGPGGLAEIRRQRANALAERLQQAGPMGPPAPGPMGPPAPPGMGNSALAGMLGAQTHEEDTGPPPDLSRFQPAGPMGPQMPQVPGAPFQVRPGAPYSREVPTPQAGGGATPLSQVPGSERLPNGMMAGPEMRGGGGSQLQSNGQFGQSGGNGMDARSLLISALGGNQHSDNIPSMGLAGMNGVTPEQYQRTVAALAAHSLGQGHLGLETARTLDPNSGSMALGRAQEDRLREQLRVTAAQGGSRATYERSLLAQPGMTPQRAAQLMQQAEEGGFFQGEAATLPSGTGTTQTQPGGGGAVTGQPIESRYGARGAAAPVFSRHEGLLDEAAGITPGNSLTAGAAPPRSIGEMLNRLDASHPGFVRSNWPAIESYLKTRYGEVAYQDAVAGAQHPRQIRPSRNVPRMVDYIRQRMMGPNEEELGLSALGNLLQGLPASQAR
jgi:hypothetical protein